MAEVICSFLWWIENTDENTSLTWSKTLIDLKVWRLKPPKILHDYWAVQWVVWAFEQNKAIDPKVISADYIILSHVHADHSAMIPYLVKKWFSWAILTTKLTRLQLAPMWQDSIDVTRKQQEKAQEINARVKKDLYLAFNIVKHYKKLQSKKTTSEQKKESEQLLKWWIWEQTLEEVYKNSVLILKDCKITKKSDIDLYVEMEEPELLYDEDDVEAAFKLIKEVDTEDYYELENFHAILNKDDPFLSDLPNKVKQWFNKRVYVDKEIEAWVIAKFKKIKKELIQNEEKNKQIQKNNIQLREKLTFALQIVKYYEEHWFKKVNFERDFSDVLDIDEWDLKKEIELKKGFSFSWKNLSQLIEFYSQNQDKFFISNEDFLVLEKEMKDIWVKTLFDIEKLLPELPDTNYENKDIRQLFGRVFWKKLENKKDFVYISWVDQYLPEEIFDMYKSWKIIYFSQKIQSQLQEKLSLFIKWNDLNKKRNFEIKDHLQRAFDIVEMSEWNHELFLKKYEWDYLSAKKTIELFKKVKQPISPKITIEQIDDFLDTAIPENIKLKDVIYIKRIDDRRIDDILSLISQQKTIYVEPKIRERVKQKIISQIQEYNRSYQQYTKQLEKYQNAIHFKRNYEARLLMYSYEEFPYDIKEAKEILQREKIFSRNDLENSENKSQLEEIFNFVEADRLLVEQWFSHEQYQNSKNVLKKFNISSREDLKSLQYYWVNNQYSLVDYDWFFQTARVVWDDFSLNDIEIINITDENDDRIYDLPYIYKDNNKVISIDESSKDKIKEKLRKWITDFYRTRKVRKERRDFFREKLLLLEFLKENKNLLFSIDWFSSVNDFYQYIIFIREDLQKLEIKLNRFTQAQKLKNTLNTFWPEKLKELQDAQAVLSEYKVSDFSDIDSHMIPQIFNSYTLEDLDKALKLFKFINFNKNEPLLEKIKLSFYNAWHIEWSIQTVITYVISQVNNVISNNWQNINWFSNRNYKHINLWFSWDMWRIHDPNLPWKPEDIMKKWEEIQLPIQKNSRRWINQYLQNQKLWLIALDYWQMETTYASSGYTVQSHKSREKSDREFFEKVSYSNWKVLVPVFSVQRLQEILIMMLKKRLSSQPLIQELQEKRKFKKQLIKSKEDLETQFKNIILRDGLESEILILQVQLKTATNSDLVDEIKQELSWKKDTFLKYINLPKKDEIQDLIYENNFQLAKIEDEIKEIEPQIFDSDIVLDAPLGEKINDIYITNCWEKYNLLDPNVQKKLFWKEIITYIQNDKDPIESNEKQTIKFDELYSEKRIHKKEVILSSSWMCQWWAIENHLKQILSDENATMLFVWFCPDSTRWGKIKWGNNFIRIDWKEYELKCSVQSVDGFSAHIWEDEILEFIERQKFSKRAKIVLTHGWENRKKLAEKIRKLPYITKQKVEVIVPEKNWDFELVSF